MALSSRLILLAGAPDRQRLDWKEESLTTGILPPFLEEPVVNPKGYGSNRILSSPADQRSLWRHLPLYRQHLQTGLTPVSQSLLVYWEPDQISNDKVDPDTSFLSTASLLTDVAQEDAIHMEDSQHHATPSNATNVEGVGDVANKDELTDFLAQSFALHDSLASSQLPQELPNPKNPSPRTEVNEDSFSTFISASPSLLASFHIVPRPLPFPVRLPTTKLCSLPSAANIQSLQPQTATVHMMVALLSVSQPRTILPKKSPRRPVQLIELTVADQTRAGLGVNLWLPLGINDKKDTPNKHRRKAEVDFDETARALRPRDLVLLRNVALGEWKGSVFAQSLRRGVSMINLLCRDLVDETDTAGVWTVSELNDLVESLIADKDDQSVAKKSGEVEVVQRAAWLRKWVLDFVGAGLGRQQPEPRRSNARRRENERDEPLQRKRVRTLPEDSQ